MEIGESQLAELFNQAEWYCEGWDEMLQEVERLAKSKSSPRLRAYMERLVPRLRNMQRRANRVCYDRRHKIYEIYNYTYEMYCWYLDNDYPEEGARPDRLVLFDEYLTPEQRDALRKRVED